MTLDQIQAWHQSGELACLTDTDLLAVQGKLDSLIDYMSREGHEVTDAGVSLTQIRGLEQAVVHLSSARCGCND